MPPDRSCLAKAPNKIDSMRRSANGLENGNTTIGKNKVARLRMALLFRRMRSFKPFMVRFPSVSWLGRVAQGSHSAGISAAISQNHLPFSQRPRVACQKDQRMSAARLLFRNAPPAHTRDHRMVSLVSFLVPVRSIKCRCGLPQRLEHSDATAARSGCAATNGYFPFPDAAWQSTDDVRAEYRDSERTRRPMPSHAT